MKLWSKKGRKDYNELSDFSLKNILKEYDSDYENIIKVPVINSYFYGMKTKVIPVLKIKLKKCIGHVYILSLLSGLNKKRLVFH